MSEQRLREGARAFAEKVFNDIREFSKDPVRGISRQGYGPLENQAHEYLKTIARELNLEIKVDRCGNLFFNFAGYRSFTAMLHDRIARRQRASGWTL